MCTVLILRRPGHAWPVLLAANRDEMVARAALPPARHWPDHPATVAGRDLLARGTWLGLNDRGVIAAVMNRMGSLGPAPDARSRGELPLIALDRPTAREAAAAVAELDGRAYRAFNLAIVDASEGFWLARRSESPVIDVRPLPEGYAMLTSRELNDPDSPRIRHYLPLARAASVPEPDSSEWAGWRALMASRDGPDGPLESMTIAPTSGFGTVSSSLLALAATPARPVWLFADGPPDRTAFAALALD
jgi:uncharacterized protein with NRDE domain